jgi:hypothetical protein
MLGLQKRRTFSRISERELASWIMELVKWERYISVDAQVEEWMNGELYICMTHTHRFILIYTGVDEANTVL